MGSVPIHSAREGMARVGLRPERRTAGGPERRAGGDGARAAAAPVQVGVRWPGGDPRRWSSWRPALSRGWAAARLWVETNEQATVAASVLAVVVISCAVVAYPHVVPWAAYLPFVVLSGALHVPARHAIVLGTAVAAILVTAALTGAAKADGIGAIIATLAVGVVTLWRSLCRAKVGVQGGRGEKMLADLRSRLFRRARVPALPGSWHAETCVESAYSQRFSGDFIVTRCSPSGRLFEVVLADVSGKGLDAGTRSLVLSGAFDALLGSVPPADFLVAANDYVARQEWSEGFATAVYLCLDLESGEYAVSGAGHPPATRYDAATGTWTLIEGGSGPVLGLVGGLRFPCCRGRVGPGEALMLYTDGVIEDRSGDLDRGIARLVSGLETYEGHFDGIAQGACSRHFAGHGDDRGAVVIWRD